MVSHTSKKRGTEGREAIPDASKGIHFVEMDFIDTDGKECADPVYRRAQRQMEKAMKK
ncbi:MAG: hypothetical protein SWO11_06205 [Thermodesulfobacteriota bacterium]|nr:hypothetical protein [Thermodesulfobacteriota bacterium]